MSESYENPIASINIEWKGIYDALCKGGDSIFEQSASLFTLCASIGHLNQNSNGFDTSHQAFRWTSLNQQTEVAILSAIAWDASNRDISVLADRREILKISMEFAEGGMRYLYDNFFGEFILDGQLSRPDKLDIEFNIAQIIEGLRREKDIFS
jgi:hypothetical protein